MEFTVDPSDIVEIAERKKGKAAVDFLMTLLVKHYNNLNIRHLDKKAEREMRYEISLRENLPLVFIAGFRTIIQELFHDAAKGSKEYDVTLPLSAYEKMIALFSTVK